MNIQEEISKEHSKTQVQKIARYIGADEILFAELIKIFLTGDVISTQRSSWILSECATVNPILISPYFKEFINKLHQTGIHDAAKRNIVRIWQEVPISEQYIGEIYDICLSYLTDNEAVAIKAFAMTVCYNITRQIPELKPELHFIIENLLLKHQHGSAAIRSRGKKILAEMKKK